MASKTIALKRGGTLLLRTLTAPVPTRRLLQATWDGLAWVVSVPIALALRYDLSSAPITPWKIIGLGLVLACLQWLVGYIAQIYRGRYRIGSLDEVVGLAAVVTIVAILGTLLLISVPSGIPRSIAAISGLIALAVMFTGRFVLRSYKSRLHSGARGETTVIYGAGDAGEQFVRLMRADRSATYQPVGFIDDDPAKSRLRLSGVRVLGTGGDVRRILDQTNASVLVVAIAAIGASRLRELDQICREQGVALRVMPTAAAIVNGQVALRDVVDVRVEDLLGRNPVATDEKAIRKFLVEKRVLITGAGGSIGSELSRQVHRYRPSAVYMLDRDESALLDLELSLQGTGLLHSDSFILADIRDSDRLTRVLLDTRPDIVFHAAALKHLPLLESFPEEALKTNVLGTANVLRAAARADVSTFVNISTDKAADPSSVLGMSKLLTEQLTAGSSASFDARYLSVRFGNVLGSRGSVLHTFRWQIEHGGPVTVTDADVTRFFMTIPEAVHLVLQAAAIGPGGRTLILDMGSPVRIADVAKQMIASAGVDVKIEYVGLRPGEKLHESLFSLNEITLPTNHPLISMAEVTPLSCAHVDSVALEVADAPTVMRSLLRVGPAVEAEVPK